MVKNILKKIVAVSMAAVTVIGCALSTPVEAKAKSDEYQTKIRMYEYFGADFALTQNIYLSTNMKTLSKYIDVDQEILRLMMMDYTELENECKRWDSLANQKITGNTTKFKFDYYEINQEYVDYWQIDDANMEGLAYHMRSYELHHILMAEVYYYSGKDVR
jgi:hypothetical protein